MRTALLSLWLLSLPTVALAHSGGLNQCGCHFNRKTNQCHCHRNTSCGCACQPATCKAASPEPEPEVSSQRRVELPAPVCTEEPVQKA